MPLEPTIEAGELDRRVTLLEPVTNQYGDEILDWTEAADVWAAIDPGVAGTEVAEAQRTVELVPTTIAIRYRTDIDSRWRIRDRDHVFEIKAIADVARRRSIMILNCVEVV